MKSSEGQEFILWQNYRFQTSDFQASLQLCTYVAKYYTVELQWIEH